MLQPAKLKDLKSRSQKLKGEIFTLECAIATAPHRIRQQRLDKRNVVPAPEPAFSRSKPSGTRLPLHLQKAARRRQLALLIELGLVIATLAAALGWMNQWFRWWV